MLGKSKSGIGIFAGSQQCQTGFSIPASGYRWSWFSPTLLIFGNLPEPVFLNVYESQESILRHQFRQPM